jgi:hypothetical protein
MKTKIATALSLVGVLGAGSAAALVNTQILDSGPSGADTTSILAPSSVALTVPTVPTTTQATTTAAPTTSQPTTVATTVVTVPMTAPTPSGFLTSYNLAPAGVVTVDVINGVVTIVSNTPSPGWTVVSAENNAAENLVEVKFSDGTTLVEFKVAFVSGALVPTVESSSLTPSNPAAPSNTAGSGNTSTTIDDDYDDDDHDDDDHDDDDHDDDDHDDGDHDDGDDDRDD